MSKAIIIGGGIIGLSSAYFLQKAGWDVTVLEKNDLADNCSFGNMGYLSPSHLVPLAAPGMIEQGFLWMFDKKSPFYVRPELSWRLVDWGLKFMRSATKKHVERSARPLSELLIFSRNLFFDWAKNEPLDFDLEKKGCIMWYKTAKKQAEELENARAAEQNGQKVSYIKSREEAAKFEPDLPPDVLGGILYEEDAHLRPNELMKQLPALLEKRGVKIFKNTEVTGFEKFKNGKISSVLVGETRHDADVFVLAAGSWSPDLAKLAGENLSLMPGKGYSMDIQNPVKKLNFPCIFLEAKVALTPWKNALRIGSTMEIGKINDEIMFPRVQGILEAVPKFMPGYLDDPAFREISDFEKLKKNLRQRVWFGFRPVSPDGMPYIGFSPKHDNLIYATGHAMLGLSMGAGTGKLVTELAGGEKTSIDLAAFDPCRFA